MRSQFTRSGHNRRADQRLIRGNFGLNLPAGWAEAARRDGQVTVAIGPCTAHWDTAPVPDDLLRSALVMGADSSAGCGCAALTADHVADLIDTATFVTGTVRVVAEEG